MVKYCAAYGCKEKFVKGGAVTFHRFPKDEGRRKLWEIKMRRSNFKATDHTIICSKHFTAESFNTNVFGGTWLQKDAVPTIFDFPNNYSSEKNKSHKPPKERKLETKEVVNVHIENDINEVNPKKKFRYMGDFTESDMSSPTMARKFLNIAMNTMKRKNLQLGALKKQNKVLKERLAALTQTEDVKENGSVTED